MSASTYSFGDFELDSSARRLTRGGDPISLPARHLGVLIELVAHAGSVVSKDALIETAWQGVAVTDNSLEQAVSALRRVLGADATGRPLIETVPRQGYRFTAPVSRAVSRVTDEALDALVAPYRAWLEGRSALETLERNQVLEARRVFERALAGLPDHAPAHVGLANACVMQYEMTRADASPDMDALALAEQHARDACRLESGYGEAWATLGFVLERTGRHVDALAASRRAVALEPDNWRHHCRLAYVGWGDERIRAARRTLSLLPGCPMAHWLAATVHVARGALDEAERSLDSASAGLPDSVAGARLSAVGLHWLRGLLYLNRGDLSAALTEFERELSYEPSGHLYTRECCANAWYGIGALELRRQHPAEARSAFVQALARVPSHPLAGLALAHVDAQRPLQSGVAGPATVEDAMTLAVSLVLDGRHQDAAALLDTLLAQAPAGSTAWLIPIEPLLHVSARPEAWTGVLTRLRLRAA